MEREGVLVPLHSLLALLSVSLPVEGHWSE